MGGTVSTRGRIEKFIQNFGRKPEGKSREIRWEGVDWLYLAWDRDQWRAHVNTVTNFRVP
jgi:hypothetical protein